MDFNKIIHNNSIPASNNIYSPVINPLVGLKRNGQTHQDIARILDRIHFESEFRKKDLLQQAIPGWTFTASIYTNGPLSYVAEDCTRWENRQTFFDDGILSRAQKRSISYRAGSWMNSWTGEQGPNLLSLIAHTLGTTLQNAICWIAETLGIDIGALNVPQFEMPRNFDFTANPQVICMFPPLAHWLLGYPSHQYCFVTEFGNQSFNLSEWKMEGETVRLFASVCHAPRSGGFDWLFVRPPVEHILFNKHRLKCEHHLPVFIYDDILLAAQHATHPNFVATWSGEKSYTADIDWSLLSGREVTYVLSNENSDSYLMCDTLRDVFNGMQTELTFEKECEGFHV